MRISNKYDLDELVRRIVAARQTPGGTRVSFDPFKIENVVGVLDSAIDFQAQVTEFDRRELVRSAVFSAAGENGFSKDSLIAHLRQEEIDYLRKPLEKYILASSVGIQAGSDLSTAVVNNTKIVFASYLPARFDRTEIQDKIEGVLSRSPDFLVQALIYVTARTPAGVYNIGKDRLDYLRALWNFIVIGQTGMRLTFGAPRPVNAILPGPLCTIHKPDGSLVRDLFWHESQGIDLFWVYHRDENWPKIQGRVKSLRARIQHIPYSQDLERAFVRYARALDNLDPEIAFHRLWSVLEYLTGGESNYEDLIRRAAFLAKNRDRGFTRMTLQHLRDVRNGIVHEDSSRSNIMTYLYQLKGLTEALFRFHVFSGKRFTARAEAVAFLDTPTDPALLKRTIDACRRALRQNI